MTGARAAPGRIRIRSGWILSMALALGALGFVAAAQWNSEFQRTTYTTSAQQTLAEQAVALEEEQELLQAQLAGVEAELASIQAASEGSQTALAAVNEELAETRLAGGLTAVTGPGVVIEIADSRRVLPVGENPANYIVLADDLRDLVAALWHAGAEAIAINGERLVATTSIYGVGSSVLVNTAFLSPPFRLEAVGAGQLDERFRAEPAYLGRVAQRIDAFDLEFAMVSSTELSLPAFIGSTGLRWAVPVEGSEE
ncbi:MAG TPA: DUF881 domain-containing protein [Candidatus Limnocylindria bacterium]|nr:DUF881 domain-containing protein [Candidatus Limnocylindria bacterium]